MLKSQQLGVAITCARSFRSKRLAVSKAVVCLLLVPLAENCFAEGQEMVTIPSNDVLSVAVGANGVVWVGTRNSVGTTYPSFARLHEGNWHVFTKQNSKKLPVNIVLSMAVAANGAMWAGTEGGGLVRVHDEDLQVFTTDNSELPNNYVSSVAVGSDGAVWAGTRGGLARFHEGDWQIFTVDNSGLPFHDVFSVAVASDGAIWVGARGSLARLHEGHWQVFKLPID